MTTEETKKDHEFKSKALEWGRMRGIQSVNETQQKKVHGQMEVTQHVVEAVGLVYDAKKWRQNYLRIEEKNRELRRIREKQTTLQRKKAAEKQSESLGINDVKLAAEHQILQAVFVSYLTRANNNSWGINRISIRNFPPTVATDPMKEIVELLTILSIAFEQNDIVIMACAELVAHKPLHQILVEFSTVSIKLELIAKFPQLRDHENETLRQLEIRDALDTTDLFRQSNRKLRGKRGIRDLRVKDNAVILKFIREEEFIEITCEEQIDEISKLLDEQILPPRRRNRPRNRKKRDTDALVTNEAECDNKRCTDKECDNERCTGRDCDYERCTGKEAAKRHLNNLKTEF